MIVLSCQWSSDLRGEDQRLVVLAVALARVQHDLAVELRPLLLEAGGPRAVRRRAAAEADAREAFGDLINSLKPSDDGAEDDGVELFENRRCIRLSNRVWCNRLGYIVAMTPSATAMCNPKNVCMGHAQSSRWQICAHLPR